MLIGFAGLGRMGRPMARNLAAAGHTVIAHDPAQPELAGLRRAGSVAELAATELTISMLPDGRSTRELVDALAVLAPAGHLHVVMGTVGPSTVRELAADSGLRIVDAPVSGSVDLAESAQITTMVGGSAVQFAMLAPVLAAMTRAQYHVGPVGSGSAAKLAVNAVLAALSQGVAEGLLLAEAGGLDPKVFYDVLRTSAAGAPYVGYKEGAFLDPGSAGVAAPVSLIRKDVGLALELAEEARLTLPGAEAVAAVLDEATDLGLGEADMAQVLEVLRVRNGLTETPPAAGHDHVIRELEDRRYAAVVDGDLATFAELAHPELAYTHSDGTVDTLSSYVEKCRSGHYVYHRIDHPIDRIVVTGGTAIVVGEMHADITAGGTRKSLANRSLAVWVRSGGAWRLLAYQPTVLPDSR